MHKILFICHGNICRSPMAEFLLKDIVKKRGIAADFEIASAATSREEIGNPVHYGKRNKQRIVPFSAELANAFRAYLPVRQVYVSTDAGALFFNRRKLRIDRRRVGLIVKHYLSLVTTQRKKSPHVLRHTFASAMLNNGADLEAIKELLGHESVATTEVYTHTTFADLKKQYKLAHPRA